MCLVIFAHRCQPGYPLVVAANRDEFYARPTEPAHFWAQHPDLLAGRDLEAGGTWMGVTLGGRFAAITNYRDPNRSAAAARSRGDLTCRFLAGQRSPRQYLLEMAPRALEYAGFNLLLGDGRELWYFSNSGTQEGGGHPLQLAPGIYGLSNAQLDTPWPKVLLGKQRMAELLASGPPGHASLAQVVGDRRLSDPEDLHPRGEADEMERRLSAQFIQAGDYGYGTRATTTYWSTDAGNAHWQEQGFDEHGQPTHCNAREFPLQLPAH